MDTIKLMIISMLIKFVLILGLIGIVSISYWSIVNEKRFNRLSILYNEILKGNVAVAIYLGLILAAFIISAGYILS